jgi:hypothetical protein
MKQYLSDEVRIRPALAVAAIMGVVLSAACGKTGMFTKHPKESKLLSEGGRR